LPTLNDTPRTRLRRPASGVSAGVLNRLRYSQFARWGCNDRASRERRRGGARLGHADVGIGQHRHTPAEARSRCRFA